MQASCAIQGKKESKKKKMPTPRGVGRGEGGRGGMCVPGIDSNWGQA